MPRYCPPCGVMISDRATEVSILRRYGTLGLLAMLIGVLAFAAAGCGGSKSSSGGGGNVTALPASSCEPLEYKGEGDPDVLIATDFPMQGSSRTADVADRRRQYACCSSNRTGRQATTRSRTRSATTRRRRLRNGIRTSAAGTPTRTPRTRSLIGVIGTFNSGCAAIEIPVLNQAPGGGLLLLSPANTYGCLTEPCAGNEPEKYYPSGKRNYARVAPSDPNQGAVDGRSSQSQQGVKSIYILNDKEAYGLGVAKNLRGAAEAAGHQGHGLRGLRPEAGELRGDLHRRSRRTNPDGDLHRRARRRELRAS